MLAVSYIARQIRRNSGSIALLQEAVRYISNADPQTPPAAFETKPDNKLLGGHFITITTNPSQQHHTPNKQGLVKPKQKTPPAWMRQLQQAATRQDATACLDIIKERLSKDPTNALLRIAIGQVLDKLPRKDGLQVYQLTKEAIKTQGLIPSSRLCVSIIKLLIDLKMLRHVETTINEMIAAGMPLNYGPFFNWASACADAGDAAGVASAARSAHRHGIPVTQHYHTLLVKALCRSGNRADTLKLLERLQESGNNPAEPTWRALIHCHGSAGHIATAKQVWDAMRASGINPGVDTWTAMINSYAECRMTLEAQQAMKEMKAAGVLPNCQTYTSLLKAFAQDGNAAAALRVLEEMQKDGVEPNAYIWTVVTGACASAGDPVSLRQLIKDMKAAGRQVGSKEYSSLLSAYRIAGDLPGCKAVLAEMKELNIPMSLPVYTEVVMLLGDHGLPEAALGAAQEMKEQGIQPDWVFYNVLINALMQNWVSQDGRDPRSSLLLTAQDWLQQGLFTGVMKLPQYMTNTGNILMTDLHSHGMWGAQLCVVLALNELKDQRFETWPALMFITGRGLKKKKAPMRDVVFRMIQHLAPVRVAKNNEGTLIIAPRDAKELVRRLQKTNPMELYDVLVDPRGVLRMVNA